METVLRLGVMALDPASASCLCGNADSSSPIRNPDISSCNEGLLRRYPRPFEAVDSPHACRIARGAREPKGSGTATAVPSGGVNDKGPACFT